MVLTHTTTHTYSHPFPTVTLAYFIRYTSPKINPFAAHVLSTDTIESRVDPATGRLHTARIHLKKSRLPAAVFNLLPASMTGGGGNTVGVGGGGAGDRASYILETSVVDIREGWMRTESRNLNWTGVLSVVERQHYQVPSLPPPPPDADAQPAPAPSPPLVPTTGVATTVIFRSRLGERLRGRMSQATATVNSPAAPASSPAAQSGQQQQEGWFSGWRVGQWGAMGIQRTIESLASKKTKDGLVKSREGMRVVLERLRTSGGVAGLLEQVRLERQASVFP